MSLGILTFVSLRNLRHKFRSHLLHASWFWITLLAGTAVCGFSNAEGTFLGLFIALYLLPVWLMAFLIRLLVWTLRRTSGKARTLTKPWLSWSIEPIVCLCLVGLISVGALKWARFAVSYPWLCAKATSKLEDMQGAGPQEWHDHDASVEICGLYRVRQWETGTATDGSPQFLILTAYMTFTDASGWAYVPSGAKPKRIKTGQPCYFDHMIGSWWRWRLDE